MHVVILGSLNMDMVFLCENLPEAGETILCSSVAGGPGGKGLNQAVAARRAGADVILAGAVGDDANGNALLAFLRDEGVDIDRVARLEGVPTGLAHIMVDGRGENAIIVASGANRALETLNEEACALAASVFLTQLEVDLDAVQSFLQRGKSEGARTILNAAPAITEGAAIFGDVDILIVNEHELAQFAGDSRPTRSKDAMTRSARTLIGRDNQTIIVTLGADGTLVVDSEHLLHIPAHPVRALDTTGAGDCFCGVLAAGIANGLPTPDAVRRANRAASLAVQNMGAAAGMPLKIEIDQA